MSVQRTPPPTAKGAIPHASELEATGTSQEQSVNNSSKISTRKKRQRLDGSPKSEFEQLKDDLQQMFTAWANEQDLKQESKFSKLLSDISELKQQNNKIQETNLQLIKFMDFASNEYDEMKKTISKLDRERLETQECVMNLEKKIQDLQLTSRSASIEIRNVPMLDKETPHDLLNIVKKLGNSFNMSIDSSEVRDVYRLPGKPGSNRTIFAEFTSILTKNNVLSFARNFNKHKSPSEKLNSNTIGMSGEPVPVYISEYLPPTTRNLFYKAKLYSKENNYQYCWTSNGNIYLRKAQGEKMQRITSEMFFRQNECETPIPDPTEKESSDELGRVCKENVL